MYPATDTLFIGYYLWSSAKLMKSKLIIGGRRVYNLTILCIFRLMPTLVPNITFFVCSIFIIFPLSMNSLGYFYLQCILFSILFTFKMPNIRVTVAYCSNPSEHSSLSSIKQTPDIAGCQAAKKGSSRCRKSK